jgi:hypothetical protein
MSLRPQHDPFAAQRLEIWGQRSGTIVIRDSARWSPASVAGEATTSDSVEGQGRTRPTVTGFGPEGGSVASGARVRGVHPRPKHPSVRGAVDVSGFCGGSSFEY